MSESRSSWVFVRKSYILAFQKYSKFKRVVLLSFNDIVRLCTIVVNIAIRIRA